MAETPTRATGHGMSDFRVVICGGGIAGVEGLLRLRRLAGDSVDIELIAPNPDLVYRPMAVREPFASGPPRRYPLDRIAPQTATPIGHRTRWDGSTPTRKPSTPKRAGASSTTRC